MISRIEPLALPIQVSLSFFFFLTSYRFPQESRDRDQNASKKMKQAGENKLERKTNLRHYKNGKEDTTLRIVDLGGTVRGHSILRCLLCQQIFYSGHSYHVPWFIYCCCNALFILGLSIKNSYLP